MYTQFIIFLLLLFNLLSSVCFCPAVSPPECWVRAVKAASMLYLVMATFGQQSEEFKSSGIKKRSRVRFPNRCFYAIRHSNRLMEVGFGVFWFQEFWLRC